jgi:hypothetical protein
VTRLLALPPFAVLFHYENGTRRAARHALFDRGHALHAAGKMLPDITAATGLRISPIVAASPYKTSSERPAPAQAAKVQALKHASPSFIAVRQLAMRFRRSCGAPGSTSSTNG